jgi:septum formation protein
MLNNVLQHYKLILASGSPRRQQFLRELDVDFEIRLKDIAEIYPETLQGAEITDFLAELKASAFTPAHDEIILTSDTIVWHNNTALGKPKDYNDAFAMLQSLAGSTHEVITSVCLKSSTKQEVFHETTRVTFNPLSQEEISYYLNKYQPYDKAGSYGIQEWIGLVAIARIEGSYANVVGLPVDKVYQKLSHF